MAILPIPDLTKKQLANFWAKIEKRSDAECWPWTGSRVTSGYGSFGINKRLFASHRLSWFLAHGPIQEGLHCCHKCDNPECCNPSHLFLGTAKENMMDMLIKGRGNKAKGERHGLIKNPGYAARGDRHGSVTRPECLRRGKNHPKSKLTEEAVKNIRARHAAGERNYVAIGLEFGINASCVQKCVSRQTWKHI